jgi:hypothetical protein
MNPTRPKVVLRLAATALCIGAMLPAVAAQADPLLNGASISSTPSVVNNTAPSISGTPVVGHTLGLSTGSWSPAGLTFAYQWKVAGADVPGATATSLPLTADYLGKIVSVRITGSKTGYTSTTVTAVSGPVTAGTVVNNTSPTINGTPEVGHTLGLSTGSWSPAGLTFAYQWKVNGVSVAGATTATFAVTSDQLGQVISVSVTGSRAGYTSATATAATTPVQLGAVVNNTSPTITGTPKVGHTLGLSTGMWSPSGLTFAYQWKVNGVNVAGATTGTFALTKDHVGKIISVSVTGARTGYAPATATASTTAVKRGTITNRTAPTVNGTPKVGHTLGLSTGRWGPSGLKFTYRWLLNGHTISGKTGHTLKVSSAYKGKRISVRVTASRSGYTSTTVVSARRAKVTG